MKFYIILSVCLALVASQEQEFTDIRDCAALNIDARTTVKPNEWECLCEQLQYKLNACEQKVEQFLKKNPSLKLCKDAPNYYLGTNQKCHYEAVYESSNNPSGKALQFALDLFRAADSKDPTKNFIISPLSLQILLAQLTDGCNELAKIEMVKGVRLNSGEVNALTNALVSSANKESNPNKLEIASVYFKAQHLRLTEKFEKARQNESLKIFDLDFSNTEQAVRVVNDWVNRMTRGSIPEIVNEQNLAPDMTMLLLNAIYFKGTWLYKFNKTQTSKRATFSVNSGLRLPAQMMSQSNWLRSGDINFGEYYNPEWGMRWVELPYAGDKLSMILMLPKARFQLDQTLKEMNAMHIQNIFKVIRNNNSPTLVNVKLPKFTVRDTTSLVQPLKKLGVNRIFTDDTALSGLSKTPTKVGDVKQEAYLSVDEDGTTATAVSKVTIIPLSLPSMENKDFIFDEPFFAMVVDKSREIPLFLAKINQPLKGT